MDQKEQLRASELSFILEAAPDPVLIQTEGRIEWINSEGCRLLGANDKTEVTGHLVAEFIDPSFHDVLQQRINKINARREPITDLMVYKIIRLNGTTAWVESKGEPVEYNGKAGALVFLRDITLNREAEKVLLENEQRMRYALQATNIGIWELDLQTRRVTSTHIPDTISGQANPPDYWDLAMYMNIVHPEDISIVQQEILKASVSDGCDFECRIKRTDGQTRWVWIAGKTTGNDSNRKTRVIGVIQDITERKRAEATLQASYSLLRIAGDIALFGGWSVDLDRNIVYWSDAVARIHETPAGYHPSVDDAINFYTPQWRADITRLWNNCIQNGIGYDAEMEIISMKGNRKWIRTIGEPVLVNNKVVRVQGAFQDISQAKAAENEIKENEERFRVLFENNLAVKLIIDPENGQITDANHVAARFYGWTVDQLKSMNISMINIMSDEEITQEMQRAKQAENMVFNFRHRKADGSIIDVEVFSSKIKIQHKEYLHSIILDVTERIANEKQLRLLSRSVEQSPVSIMITDTDGLIEYVNPYFESLTGYSLDEVRGKSPSFLNSGFHPHSFFNDLWDTILAGNDWHGEILNKKKNGVFYWESIAISPIVNQGGMVTNFVSVHQDITERKKIMEDLVIAKEKAEESDRLKMAFLANISHEIRTPMNGIMGFAGILKNNTLTRHDQLRYISIIEKSGQRMLDTINDLIDIARIETGQVKLHKTTCDINEIMLTLYELLLPRARQKNLQLMLNGSLPDDHAVVSTDAAKLNAVLTHLVKNAIKFTPKGKIEIGCMIRPGFLEFYISDTGVGVPPDRQTAIFRRFEQADMKDARTFQGSGLGLAISKAYVELLGGKIWVKSNPGKGSTFSFTLPVESVKKHIKTLNHEAVTVSDDIPDIPGKAILIAEDDMYSGEMIQYLINKTGADVVLVDDGNLVIEEFKKKDFDLVLLDIQLPGKDGFTLLREIKFLNPFIPVISQTAYAMPEDINRLKAAGFTDNVVKPINTADLYNILTKYLSKGFE